MSEGALWEDYQTMNGINGETSKAHMNGDWSDSNDEDIEEVEPVSASLVLKIVSEPTTPSLSRKTPLRRNGEDDGYSSMDRPTETYLQVVPQILVRSPSPKAEKHKSSKTVAVQRSTSTASLPRQRSRNSSCGSQAVRSRNPSSSGYDLHHMDQQLIVKDNSRDGSISPLSGYSDYDIDMQKPSGINSVDFMNSVSRHTKMIQSSVKELRGEVANPLKVLDIGQEAIILSGLNKKAGDSLKNIKNLYDETKYLKSYLEKLEAKVHYDITMKSKSRLTPSWCRRIGFISLVGGLVAYMCYRRDPDNFNQQVVEGKEVLSNAWDVIATFFTKDCVATRTVRLTQE
jgi:hypothetical protein